MTEPFKDGPFIPYHDTHLFILITCYEPVYCGKHSKHLVFWNIPQLSMSFVASISTCLKHVAGIQFTFDGIWSIFALNNITTQLGALESLHKTMA